MLIRKIDAQKPTVSKKLRVAAYCRVSTDQEDQKESLEAQKAHYESWIKRHSDWEFAGVFYDLGISGTKADSRDGLQALLYADFPEIPQTAFHLFENCFHTISRFTLKRKIWILVLWRVS